MNQMWRLWSTDYVFAYAITAEKDIHVRAAGDSCVDVIKHERVQITRYRLALLKNVSIHHRRCEMAANMLRVRCAHELF